MPWRWVVPLTRWGGAARKMLVCRRLSRTGWAHEVVRIAAYGLARMPSPSGAFLNDGLRTLAAA